MNNVYYVGSGELTFDLIERIINENLKLELAPEAKLRIQKCRDYLDKKIAESEEPLYGITTGFGSLCSKSISSDELGTLQENLIKSHACSVGEEIRPVIIKLMMLLKAHALSLGHSGVQVITVQRILDFFNNDVMPIVYDRGSLGASGDLAPLANLFLPLIGVGDVYYKGKKREAISVLDEFGWEPVKLMSKEGLALLNGTQFMSANGVFALLKAFRLSKKADLIAALSLEAFDGRIDPFMDSADSSTQGPDRNGCQLPQTIGRQRADSPSQAACTRPLFVPLHPSGAWGHERRHPLRGFRPADGNQFCDGQSHHLPR